MKPHVFHPAADSEYAEAAKYFASIDLKIGGRFYDEIERLIVDVRKNPIMFRVFDPPMRRHFSTVFPYAVIYLDRPESIWIVAVMHCKQRPGYWRARLS